MYIHIAFSIELRLRVSRSLRLLANYRPSPLAQKPSNDVLACGDPITPSNTVKYHSSLNTLISTEQWGGVRNKYIYIYICIYVKTNIGHATVAKTISRICGKIYKTNPSLKLQLLVWSWLTDLAQQPQT